MVKFYKCNKCGNVVIKGVDSGVALSCCGEEMTELVPNTEDAATEKHVPVLSTREGAVHVEVSSVEHPMTEEHSIKFIVIDKGCSYFFKPLDPGKKAEADFSCNHPDKIKGAYAYCNLHGLWFGEL